MVSIDQNGLLTVSDVNDEGVYTITATDSVSGLSATLTVTVSKGQVIATSLTMDGDTTITGAGEHQYTVTVEPSDAVTNLTWSAVEQN